MVPFHVLIAAALFSCASARTLLFLSPDALSGAVNVTHVVGSPSLEAVYPEGVGGGLYAGWAYPSVVRGQLANGSSGFLMLYSACPCSAVGCWGREPLYTFLAESSDGIAWAPVVVPSAPPGAPPGALFTSEEVGSVYDDAGGVGVGVGERYKLLRPDTRILVSDDARSWSLWQNNWTLTSVDPGFHALRAARGSDAVIITARPQALRPQGRHVGVISSPTGWAGLGPQDALATQPLDTQLYRFTDQIYGLPAFDYAAVLAADDTLPPALRDDTAGGNYVAYAWRLIAPNGETGFLPTQLAYSSDGLQWAAAPAPPAPVEPIANDMDLPYATYAHVYGSWPSAIAGAAACDAACRNDSTSCVAWAYVSPSAALGAERCALKRDLCTPVPTRGVVSGFRSDLAYKDSSPLPALPPLFELPTNASAGPAAGLAYRQFYPKSMIAVHGRLLIHASASAVLHGDSAPNASAILVYSLRADGFVGLAGPLTGRGVATTRALAWGGGDVALNVLCGELGSVRVQVLPVGGTVPVAGFDFAACDAPPARCDDLAWVATWRGRGLDDLAGRNIQLQLELTDGARVFAVRGNWTANSSIVAHSSS